MLPSPLNVDIDEGSGETIVLLHGFLGCSEDWRALIDPYKSNYRLVAINLPGHGETPVTSFNWANPFWRLVDELERHIRQLGAGKVHLLGYSMGSRVALSLALHRPHLLSSLILEGASPGLESEQEQQARQQQEYDWTIKLTAGNESFLEIWAALPMFAKQQFRNKSAFDLVQQRRVNGDVDGWINALKHFGLSRQPNYWPRLDQLELPTLLITGDEDEKFTNFAQRMRQLIPNSHHQLIAESGHAPHLDQPDSFAQTLDAFLKSL